MIFDEPAKGRKQCPECKKYVNGLRTIICSGCSYNFQTNKKETIDIMADSKTGYKVFDGPGKGRKQCKECQKYISAVHVICPLCSHDFKTDAPKVVERTGIFKEGGKGRKQCPCGVFLGSRVSVCPNCSHDFKAEAEEEEAPENSTEGTEGTVIAQRGTAPRIDYGQYAPIKNPHPTLPSLRVFIPAGECPVKLKGTDIDSVADWAEGVRDDFGSRNLSLSTQGLMYFAQRLYDFRSAECIQVKEHLRQLFLS